MPKPSLLKERRLDPIVPGYFYANVPQLKLYRFCSDIRSLNTFSTLESSCGRKKSKSVHSFQQKKKKKVKMPEFISEMLNSGLLA